MRDEDKTREELLAELQRTRIHTAHLMEAEAFRRQAEKELEQVTHIAAAIVRNSPCGLFVLQRQSPDRLVLVDGNPQVGRLMGVTLDELRGAELEDMWPEAGQQGLKHALLNALDTGQVFETDDAPYARHSPERLFRIRAFRLPNERVGLYVADASTDQTCPETQESVVRTLLEPLEPILGDGSHKDETLDRDLDHEGRTERTDGSRDEELAAQLAKAHARLAKEIELRSTAEELVAALLRESDNRVEERIEELTALNQSLERSVAESQSGEEAVRAVCYELEQRLANQENEIGELAEALEIEIAEHKKTEESLVAARIELETRMIEVDDELAMANERLRDQVTSSQRLENELHASLDERERVVHELNALLREATESLDRERARRESSERGEAFSMQDSHLGFAALDAQGMITLINPKLAEMFDAAAADALQGANVADSPLMQESGLPEAVADCLRSGEPSLHDCPFTAASGRHFLARVHLAPIRTGHEEITGCRAVFEDVTAARVQEARMIRGERFNAFGCMARGAAGTFTAVVQTLSDRIQEALTCVETANFSDIAPLLESMLARCREAGRTTRRLRQLARALPRKETPQKHVFDLTEVIRESIEMDALWSRPDPSGGRYDITVEPAFTEGCLVEGEEDDFIEVMTNLLENAVEASPGGGAIRVESYPDGDEVVVRVRDTGTGIRRDRLPHLFEPFWTTKEGHDGLGLSIVFGIMRRYRGTTTVSADEQRGTVFTLRLPLAKEAPPEESLSGEEPVRGNYRILLIYSLPPVARMVRKKLTRFGYTVFDASSVPEGIAVLKRTKIHAVVCDLAEDEADWQDVSGAVELMNMETGYPKPPIIVLAESVDHHGESGHLGYSNVNRIVEKPVSVARLVGIVTEELRDAAHRCPEFS